MSPIPTISLLLPTRGRAALAERFVQSVSRQAERAARLAILGDGELPWAWRLRLFVWFIARLLAARPLLPV